MKIQFVDLNAQYNEIREEVTEAIQNVIKDSAFIGGKYLKQFESNYAEYIGTKHCIGVGNGTDALHIALKALGIEQGDEVITVANSFIATSEAVTNAGAVVKFVDCLYDTYNIDIERIKNAITGKTRAIIPVHLYGQPVDMDPLLELAKKHDLRVVEDCAQAHGARYKGKNVGTFGDCACFSFFPGKNLGAYGDAGAVLTNDDKIAKMARMYANHGRFEKYNQEFEGVNSRLDGIQAAILNVKLKHLERWTERRREIARRYDEGLSNVVVAPKVLPDVRHVYHLYIIRINSRDEVKEKLAAAGVATGIHYPIPLPSLKAYSYLGHKENEYPIAHSLSREILSLPIHGSMKDDEVSYVIEKINGILT